MTRQSLLQALAAMTFVSACVAPGDRAASGDFTCPAGETCSPDTPEGLWFSGAQFFDEIFVSGPHPIATGGTETIRVLASSSGADLFSDPFYAESSPPLVVESSSHPSVVVRANDSGSGYLRILDPESKTLYDRISIGSASIQSMRIMPIEAPWFDPDAAKNLEWALFGGASVTLGVVLRDASDERLVDESISFSVSGEANEDGDGSAWDRRSVSVGSGGYADVFVQSGAGDLLNDSLPIVTTIDDVVPVENIFGADTSFSISAGAEKTYCFRGLSGSRAVAGLSWSVSTEGSIVAKRVDQSCFNVKAMTQGLATLFVSVANLQKAFPITMTNAVAPPAPEQKIDPSVLGSGGPVQGERAR